MKKPIEVFIRHCYYSKLQELPDRTRPKWFNKIKVFENFKKTLNSNLVNYTIIYDEYYGSIENTFLAQEKNVEIINCGSECDSFLKTLDIIHSRNFEDDQIVYLLEDDYLHRSGWCDIMLEGFTINPSYITLYDFEEFNNQDILCKIFSTDRCHWRSIPASTNTFACRYKTLLEDLKIHEKYSSSHVIKEKEGFYFSKDYDKFWELQKHNRYVISPIPGWSTHCDANFLSPIIDWEKIISYNLLEEHEKIIEIKYS